MNQLVGSIAFNRYNRSMGSPVDRSPGNDLSRGTGERLVVDLWLKGGTEHEVRTVTFDRFRDGIYCTVIVLNAPQPDGSRRIATAHGNGHTTLAAFNAAVQSLERQQASKASAQGGQ